MLFPEDRQEVMRQVRALVNDEPGPSGSQGSGEDITPPSPIHQRQEKVKLTSL